MKSKTQCKYLVLSTIISLALTSGCALGWLTGATYRSDVTDKITGDDVIASGDVIELRNVVYVIKSDVSENLVALAPESLDWNALDVAQREHGDARLAPPEFSLATIPIWFRPGGDYRPQAIREAQNAGDPDKTDTLPAGTRFRVNKVTRRTNGDNSSLFYSGVVLNGRYEGWQVALTSLTNLGVRGYSVSGQGYGVNPLVGREVEERKSASGTGDITDFP